MDPTIENARAYLPGWSDQLIQMVLDEWDTGIDFALAIARVETSPEYAAAFPGLVREDGSLRFANEQDYLAAQAIFNETLEDIGLNPAMFQETFVTLLENEVGISEARDRIDRVVGQVLDRSPEMIAAVQGMVDVNPELATEAGLIAWALDPNIGQQLIDRTIGIAQISSAGSIRNFNIDLGLAERLYEVGITEGQATEAFGDAASVVPVLNVLAQRHNDPDDTFDINEFVGASLLDDPFERRRMRRLLAQERSSFTEGSTLARDRSTGAVTGLATR